jgi:hypothetical protein
MRQCLLIIIIFNTDEHRLAHYRWRVSWNEHQKKNKRLEMKRDMGIRPSMSPKACSRIKYHY